jgi:hypothetical protein
MDLFNNPVGCQTGLGACRTCGFSSLFSVKKDLKTTINRLITEFERKKNTLLSAFFRKRNKLPGKMFRILLFFSGCCSKASVLNNSNTFLRGKI